VADLKAKAHEILSKVQNDKDFAAKFQKDPVKALEAILGVDLPDDQINELIKLVKTKLTADTVSQLGASLFGKK